MKIAIGCDEAAWDMKQAIGAELRRQGHEVIDHGTHDGAPVLYPDIAVAVAESGAFGSQKVISAADRASGWLLIAKQRAVAIAISR